MKMWVFSVFLVFFSFSPAVIQALQWTSASALPTGTIVHVCSGQNVTFAWAFSIAPAETTVNTEWYYFAPGHDQTLIATETAGLFLKSPTAPQEMVFIPNAGIQLFNVSTSSSGTYFVSLNLNIHGSIQTLFQRVILNVTDTGCQDSGFEMSALENQIDELQSESQELHNRFDRLQSYPPFRDALEKPTSCADVQRYDNRNGVHTIYMSDGTTIPVYCDQSTTGGWTVIQRRVDGTTNFYRGWQEYEDGFGFLEGEFWLGLQNMHKITTDKNQTLRLECQLFSGHAFYIEYTNFVIGDRSTGYQINNNPPPRMLRKTDPFNDELGAANNYGIPFSTPDRDTSYNYYGNLCVPTLYGGWWYSHTSNACSRINFNGRYKHVIDNHEDGILYSYRSYCKHAEMKLKPT